MTSFARWRFRTTLALAGSLLIGLGSLPATAQGAPAPAEEDSPEVEKQVSLAIELRAEGKDLQALEALKRAAELEPTSARVQVHLANVYQALGDWVLADQYLRMALAQATHPYVLRHREALEEAREVIGDNLGTLAVEGEPAGAEVRLNGRLIGSLPLAAPVPVTVGSYTLEVRLPGHYTARRPLSIAGHDVVRESVRLERLPEPDVGAGERVGPASLVGQSDAAFDRPANRPWLTWTLAGLGAAAGATSVGAVLYREAHAKRWNDDSRCLAVGFTREQVCGAERNKVDTADGLAIATGVAAGLLGLGAFVNAFVFSPSGAANAEIPARAGLQGCSLGSQGASCFGTF